MISSTCTIAQKSTPRYYPRHSARTKEQRKRERTAKTRNQGGHQTFITFPCEPTIKVPTDRLIGVPSMHGDRRPDFQSEKKTSPAKCINNTAGLDIPAVRPFILKFLRTYLHTKESAHKRRDEYARTKTKKESSCP